MTNNIKNKFSEKLRYAFDNLMAKGTAALIGILSVILVLVILLVSFIAWSLHFAADKNFIEIAWMSLMRTLDAGIMGGDEGTKPLNLLMKTPPGGISWIN